MNNTRIAGTAFDARDALLIRQTARIYSYTRHIRRLATDAAPKMDLAVATMVDVPSRRSELGTDRAQVRPHVT